MCTSRGAGEASKPALTPRIRRGIAGCDIERLGRSAPIETGGVARPLKPGVVELCVGSKLAAGAFWHDEASPSAPPSSWPGLKGNAEDESAIRVVCLARLWFR